MLTDALSKQEQQFRQLLKGLVEVNALTAQQAESMVTPKETKDFVVRLLEADIDDKKLASVLAVLFHCELFGGVIRDTSTIIRSGSDICPWLIADDILYVTNPYDRAQIEPLMRRKKNEQDQLNFSRLGIISMRDFDSDVVTNAMQEKSSVFIETEGSGIWARDIVDALLIDGIARQATDIHITPETHGVVIRYRIDGRCDKVRQARFQNLGLDQLKLIANNLMDRVGKQNNYLEPCSGYMAFTSGHKQISIRMEMAPMKVGTTRLPKFTLRLLNIKRSITRLEHFELPEHQFNCLKALSGRPHGLIIVTGPTGSGKSTTLKAMLREIRHTFPEKTIYTIEDPVEEQLDGVMSIEIDQHVSFATALRSLLRHDPDVIMVGEIRDQLTAELAMRAALTGHLVLTTLHSNDAHGALNRLRDFGIENALLADNVLAITAQRLVPKICPYCSETVVQPLHNYFMQYLPKGVNRDVELRQRSEDADKFTSCQHCQNGYHGRTLVQEIFEVTPSTRDAIARGEGAQEIRRMQRRKGEFVDIWHHACSLLLKGQTSLEALESKLGSLTLMSMDE